MYGGLGKPVTLTKNHLHFYLRNENLHYLHILYCLLYSNIPTRSKVTGIFLPKKLLREKNMF